MNSNESRTLCGRVAAAYGRAFNPDTILEWGRHLEHRDNVEANNALDRIIQAGEPGPSIGRLLAEISAHTPRRPSSYAGDENCPNCGGLGFEQDAPLPSDPSHIDRWRKCHVCRPRKPA